MQSTTLFRLLLVVCCLSSLTAQVLSTREIPSLQPVDKNEAAEFAKMESSEARSLLQELRSRLSSSQQQKEQTADKYSFVETSSTVNSKANLEVDASVDESVELVSTLKDLITSRKERDRELESRLKEAQEHSQQLQRELEHKQRMLARHTVMLSRLETCLAQGPMSKQLEQEKQHLKELETLAHQHETALLEQESQIKLKHQAVTQKESILQQQVLLLLSKQQELQKAEQTINQLKNQVLMEKQQHQASIDDVVRQRVEAEVAVVRQQLHNEYKQQLQAITQSNIHMYMNNNNKQQQPTATVFIENETKIRSHLRKQHNKLHSHKTFAPPSPLAPSFLSFSQTQTPSATVTAAVTATTPVTATATPITTGAVTFSTTPDAATTATTDATTTTSTDATATTTTTSTSSTPGNCPINSFFPASGTSSPNVGEDLTYKCFAHKECSTCQADPYCAWCSSPPTDPKFPEMNKPRCLYHDVNSKLRGFGGDGLTSGKCNLSGWNSKVDWRLSLLSLNTFGADSRNSTTRGKNILKLITTTNPDVIAFQEVDDWVLETLNSDPEIVASYYQTDYGNGQAPGGLFIMSKFPVTSVGYYEEIRPGQVSTSQRAKVLIVRVKAPNGQEVTIANTCLDWRSNKNRASSLDFVFALLRNMQDVVLVGDFNFDAGAQPETARLPSEYMDLWPALQPEQPGYTWDPYTNEYAAASDPNSRPSRIDRMFLNSRTLLPRDIKLVGCHVADLLCGSMKAVDDLAKSRAPANTAVTVKVDSKTGSATVTSTEEGYQPSGGIIASQDHPVTVVVALETSSKITSSSSASATATSGSNEMHPSNHYGLLLSLSHFNTFCPA